MDCICNTCKMSFPHTKEYFYFSNSKKNRLSRKCKHCCLIYKRERTKIKPHGKLSQREKDWLVLRLKYGRSSQSIALQYCIRRKAVQDGLVRGARKMADRVPYLKEALEDGTRDAWVGPFAYYLGQRSVKK